jgi:hypothetical protein
VPPEHGMRTVRAPISGDSRYPRRWPVWRSRRSSVRGPIAPGGWSRDPWRPADLLASCRLVTRSCTSRDPTGPHAFRTIPDVRKGRLAPALTCGFSGADDGIRTRDPHLGNCMARVSCVSASLSSAPELHVLVALVSCVSADCWSRLDFVGDFVGVHAANPTVREGAWLCLIGGRGSDLL